MCVCKTGGVEVIFRRTGERRYAVVVQVPGMPAQAMDPAPGFDQHIPHDLVHYVVEATLQLSTGVFGRAARGGGTFIPAEQPESARERARQRRKQARREQQLRRADSSKTQEMATSERLAALCDLAWRRRHGQRPDPARAHEPVEPTIEDAERIERVLSQLDQLAPIWHSLPIQGEIAFVWPSLTPRGAGERRAGSSSNRVTPRRRRVAPSRASVTALESRRR